MQVSVLMPSYNQGQFIERSARSVMSQSSAQSLELLVVDGGSTDDTLAVLNRLQMEFGENRIRWKSEPDRGPGNALNKAFALAKGSVIGWLNSDDLYLPGAVERALTHFNAHPDHWMVYGQAQHVDASDEVLEPYPTRGPEAGLAGFADGCFICQPSVFMRRIPLRMLGGFDESQKTAFDLALWMKFFGLHQSRIGFIDSVQAQSRLHDACITLTQRERVMRESMSLLARYLGAAPMHWVQTYVTEVLAEHPFGSAKDPVAHLHEFTTSVLPLLSTVDRIALPKWLASDARLKAIAPGVGLTVYPDGWMPSNGTLKVAHGPARVIELTGRHVAPKSGDLTFVLELPDGQKLRQKARRGAFSVAFALPAFSNNQGILPLKVEGGFVPARDEPASTDNRELACRIDSIRLVS